MPASNARKQLLSSPYLSSFFAPRRCSALELELVVAHYSAGNLLISEAAPPTTQGAPPATKVRGLVCRRLMCVCWLRGGYIYVYIYVCVCGIGYIILLLVLATWMSLWYWLRYWVLCHV